MNDHSTTGAASAGPRMRRIKVPDSEQPHWCFPLTDPNWVPSDRASHMRPDDAVLGVEFNGGVWALPWWIMKNHHIANLVLNGKELLVTLCEVCSAAAAFDPVIDGKRYHFKLGGLFNGTIMPQDYETGSLWTGFSGEAIEGPMKGRAMERLPLLQCTWEEWLRMHPETLVPDGAGEARDGHGEGRAPGSPYIGPDMGDLLAKLDTRLPHYELVLGVLSDGESRCYPLAVLGDIGGVVNDKLGGNEIVALGRPGSWMASAYSRVVGDRLLTFTSSDGGILDQETGSRWEISGRCSSGPLAGAQLKYVNSGVEEFFLWAAFNPGTDIYQTGAAATSSGPVPRQWSATDAVPAPVYAALKQKWFRRGMKLLDVACGDGMIAALLAEVGLDVFALDAAEQNISRARLHFRGVANLEFAVGDLTSLPSGDRRFDAIIDHGFFAGLAAAERSRCVNSLAAVSAPGAHFLLLFPVPADAMQQRVNNVERMFAPRFELLDFRPTTLPDLRSGRVMPGAAVRLKRRS